MKEANTQFTPSLPTKISRYLFSFLILIISFTIPAESILADFDPNVLKAQIYLEELGYDPGPIDGKSGARTKQAIQAFQHKKNLSVTGRLESKTLAKIFETAPEAISVANLNLAESINVEYVTHELKSAFNDGVIIPKEGMTFVIAEVRIANGSHRNLAFDLSQAAVIADNGKLYESKAYSLFANSYFAYAYYEEFKGLAKMEAGASPAPVIEFDNSILKLLGVANNTQLAFRIVFEVPASSKIKEIAWHGSVLTLSVPLPKNGATHLYVDRERVAPLDLVTKGEKVHYLVKLSDWSTGEPVQVIFIRAGETVETKVPLGQYRLKYAAGSNWLGETELFGEKTIYKKAKKRFDFFRTNTKVTGYKVELILQPGGNLPTQNIPKTEW